MPSEIIMIENNGEGYEVCCDSCDSLFGWVPVKSKMPKKLLLCENCTAGGCTEATLRRAAKHCDKRAIEEMARRSVI